MAGTGFGAMTLIAKGRKSFTQPTAKTVSLAKPEEP
jgi:hypothetical protein